MSWASSRSCSVWEAAARGAPDRPQAARDLSAGPLPLDPRGPHDHVRLRMTAPEHLEHVPNGGAVKRGDDANAAWKKRQRPLAAGVEQALGLQPLLELLERHP